MSIVIPELSFNVTAASHISSSVVAENYSQFSYFIVAGNTGSLAIQGSIDGATWYTLQTVTIASSGTPYSDKINIVTKFIRISITLAGSATINTMCFFFDSGSINIYNTIGGGVSSVSASGPLASTGGSTPNISLSQASAIQDGFLSSGDFASFSNKVSSVSGTAPVAVSAGTNPVVSMAVATDLVDGYLSAADHASFASKQPAGTYVTSVSASSPLSSTGTTTPTISLNDSGAVAGSYTNSNITISAKGIVTSISSGSGGGNKSFFAASAGDNNLSIGTGGVYSSLTVSRGSSTSSTISRVQTVIPCDGTFSRLYANRDSGGATYSVSCTLYIDGSATALTCTLGAADTNANDTTHSVAVTAGQLVAIGWFATGGFSTAKYYNTGVQFVAS
jgi:hypothetical protein